MFKKRGTRICFLLDSFLEFQNDLLVNLSYFTLYPKNTLNLTLVTLNPSITFMLNRLIYWSSYLLFWFFFTMSRYDLILGNCNNEFVRLLWKPGDNKMMLFVILNTINRTINYKLVFYKVSMLYATRWNKYVCLCIVAGSIMLGI